MRGKVIKTKSVIFSTGITPAYAGKSCQQNGYDFLFQDHPRLCGEKGNRKRVCPAFCRITPAYAGKSEERYCQGCDVIGSPPPMRGKADCMTFCRFRRRITPAYAGKSSLFPRSSVILEDHPRLCGEKPPSACTGGRCGGSPPPMRGKDLSAGQLRRNHRITPAYAGKRSLTLRR